MSQRSSHSGWSAIAGRWILAGTLFGAAVSLGAVHTAVLCLVTGGLAVSAWLLWNASDPMSPRPVATIVLGTGVVLTAYTLLQTVPLPASWLTAVAPMNADVWARALRPFHESGPDWTPLSLDPVASRVETLRGVTYLLAFVSAWRVARLKEGVTFLSTAIVATGAVLAVAALLHPALGAERLFGLYQPSSVGHRHLAPLINPNHLSAYLDVAFCLALATAFEPEQPSRRVVHAALALFLVITNIWIASRGGVAAMFLGGGLVISMTIIRRRAEVTSRVGLLVPGIVVAAGAAMLILASSDEAWGELSATEVSKLDLARQALRLVPLAPVFGIGRGAFESTFPVVRTGTGYVVFTHPENVVVQWITEWGAPIAVGAAVALVIALRPRSVLVRSPGSVGAWCAIVCVGTHNLVDFSSEIPGVMVALTVCAAIVVGGTGGRSSRPISRWAGYPPAVAWICVAAGLATILLVLPGLGHEVANERARYQKMALEPGLAEAEFRTELRAAVLRHPAEPYLPYVGGFRARARRDGSVMPWVERTLERAPVYGPAHLLLARDLARFDPSQARMEYRYAMVQDSRLMPSVQAETLPQVHGYDDAIEIAPPEIEGVPFLEAVAAKLEEKLPATVARIDEEIVIRDPTQLPPSLRAVNGALSDLRAGDAAPWCAVDRTGCVQSALALVERLRTVSAGSCEAAVVRARVLVEAGDSEQALSELDAAADVGVDQQTCLRGAVTLAITSGLPARADRAIEKLTRVGCTETAECADNLVFAAEAEIQRGRHSTALAFYEKAAERAPARDDLLERIAVLASRRGLHGEAAGAYQRLAARHPEDVRWSVAEKAERTAVGREAVTP